MFLTHHPTSNIGIQIYYPAEKLIVGEALRTMDVQSETPQNVVNSITLALAIQKSA